MLSEPSSGSDGGGGGRGGESGDGRQKLDARRTDALKLADRVEALKRVERSLLNCKRLGDPELLQANSPHPPLPGKSPCGAVQVFSPPILAPRDFFPFVVVLRQAFRFSYR